MRPCLFALSLLSGVALAQEPAPPAADGQKKGKLEGSVVHALSKEPIRRAEVTLIPVDRGQGGLVVMAGGGPDGPPGTRRATTDQEGKYVFADVEPGRYSLWAQKAGFLRGSYGARGGGTRSMGTQINVSASGTVSGAKIELTPQGIISGRVLDEEGEPMQNLQVMVMREQYINSRKQTVPMNHGQTNDRGEFRIADVSPGQVLLQIAPARWSGTPVGATDAAPNMAYVSTFYPGATEMSQAAKIEVTPGAELSGFEVKLQKARVSRIRGKVLDPSGQPAKNFSVNLMPKDSMFFGPMMPQFSRAQDGTFELQHVQPGTYTLMVQSGVMMGDRRGMTHREPITVGNENIDDLVVRMSAPIKVEGQIVLKGDLKVDPKTVRISLMDESGRGWGPGPQQTVNDDGTFVLENASPGKYRINAFFMPVESAYIESVLYGDQDAMGKDIEISSSPSPIRVIINGGAGTATGVVMKDNNPAPGAAVVLLNADKSKRDQTSTKMGPTDQNATFTIKNIPPGEYLAFAFDNMEYGFWQDEERLKKIESKAKKVSISRDGSASVNLDMIPLPD